MDERAFELRVLEILDRVEKGLPIEDGSFEVKTNWPSANEHTARELAGLANAIRGPSVAWIVGADEKRRRVSGADGAELANWWPAVQKHFHSNPPRMRIVKNITWNDQVVVGLQFDVTETPFLTRVEKGRAVHSEIPWREGNGTRPADRKDLLLLLSTVTTRIPLEIWFARIFCQSRATDPKKNMFVFNPQFYLAHPGTDRVVFPFHQMRTEITCARDGLLLEAKGLKHRAPYGFSQRESFVTAFSHELVAEGPGQASLEVDLPPEFTALANETDLDELRITTTLFPIGSRDSTSFVIDLSRTSTDSDDLRRWPEWRSAPRPSGLLRRGEE